MNNKTMTNEITIDEEFKSLIPPLSEEERSGLESSIKSEGCRDAIKVWSRGNVLLDGHNRKEICDTHGIAYRVDIVDLPDRRDALLWIIDNQFNRRNLAPYTRAELATRREEIARKEAKERQREHGKTAPGKPKTPVQNFEQVNPMDRKSTVEAAKTAGVSHETYRKAKQIKEWGVDPETEQKLRTNQVSIHRVHKDLKEERERAERKAKRDEAAKGVELDERIIVGDFRDNADKIADGSLSLIFTDPPYDRKASLLLPDLAKFAARKLASGGSLLCYVGQTQLPAALNAFGWHLQYYWTIACLHSGHPTIMREYGIKARWKAVLWYVKDNRDDNTVFVEDVMSGGREKDGHDWQQAESEAAYWIEKLCPFDGIVCDPFLGYGTTAAAAKDLNRQWIGFEIDPDTANHASARLNK